MFKNLNPLIMNWNIIKKCLLTGLLLMALSPAVSREIYVSLRGSDKASGSLKQPLKTLHEALRRAGQERGQVDIVLRGGMYHLQQPVVIRRDQVRLRAYRGEQVVLSGGKAVKDCLRRVKDASVLERVEPRLHKYLYELDFKKHGLALSDIHAVGFGRASIPAWSELFTDEGPLSLSRWPKDSMVLIGKVVAAGKEGELPIFGYSIDRPARWKDISGLWIAGYFAHGYADDQIKVKSIDQEQKLITAAQSTNYGFMTGAKFRRWYAVNQLEELDTCGEYVIDKLHEKIYTCLDLKQKGEVYLSVMDAPLISVIDCSDVRVEGLTLAYGRGVGVYMERTNRVVVQGCTIRDMGSLGVSIGKGYVEEGSPEAPSAADSKTLGLLQRIIYDDILFNRDGGQDNGVVDCHIHHVGGGGVSLGGGDRRSLTPARNYVENCRIHDFNRIEKSYKPGVWIDGVGNRVTQCDIYNAPSMAILLHGNDHVIEYCDIHDVCSEIDDQGAIYYGRDPSELGNVVRYCYLHHLAEVHRTTGVYHDDGACGMEVYGNIFHKAGSMPSLIGGGHNNRYHGNIFLCSPVAIHVDARMQNWGRFMIQPDAVLDKRLKAVRYQEPPYSTAYPWLPDYWKGDASKPHGNVIEGNLFYKIGNLVDGKTEWLELYNNWATNDNPGFVDEENPLKGFVKNAPVFERIRGFEPIAFDKIGCRLK